jgi:glycosyltransferase involved in cell wall biosynthesis
LGIPAIVTDVGGMAEVVRLANAGYTVPTTSAPEMAAAILKLASSETERKEFSANAESTFHAHFSLQTMIDAYMDLYQNTPRARRAASR